MIDFFLHTFYTYPMEAALTEIVWQGDSYTRVLLYCT